MGDIPNRGRAPNPNLANTAQSHRQKQNNAAETPQPRGWKTFVTTWQTPLHDRFFAIASFAISLIGLAAGIVLAKEGEKLTAALVSVSIATTVLAILVVSLVRQLWTATNELSRSRMTESAATKIADTFCELVARQSEFEGAVALYVANYLNKVVDSKDYDRVADECVDFIKAIVHAATFVIATKKGHPADTCTANFKVFKRQPPNPDSSNLPDAMGDREVVSDVLFRSTHALHRRRNADRLARANNNLPQLSSNRMYATVLEKEEQIIVGDLADYVQGTIDINEANKRHNETSRRIKLPIFEKPNRETLKDYTSCLLLPVHGTDVLLRLLSEKNRDGDKGDDGVILPFGGRDGSLVGLFCIDSMLPNYFDNDYDTSIMTQLANHAFSAFRTLYAVRAMHDDYNPAQQGSR